MVEWLGLGLYGSQSAAHGVYSSELGENLLAVVSSSHIKERCVEIKKLV
jgi:hypothetical protein